VFLFAFCNFLCYANGINLSCCLTIFGGLMTATIDYLIGRHNPLLVSEPYSDLDEALTKSFYAKFRIKDNPFDYPIPPVSIYGDECQMIFVDTANVEKLQRRLSHYSIYPKYQPSRSTNRPSEPYWLAVLPATTKFTEGRAVMTYSEYLIYCACILLAHHSYPDLETTTWFPETVQGGLWGNQAICANNLGYSYNFKMSLVESDFLVRPVIFLN
jgi:hypothetical protein